MAWSSGISLRGTAGAQLRYGHGAPSTSNPTVQNDGDSYIDVDAGRLYAVRASGAWPSTYASLVGPAGPTGISLQTCTGQPSSTLGNAGDWAIDQTNAFLYGPKSATTGWPSPPISLVGPSGTNGTGSGGISAARVRMELGTFWTPAFMPTSFTYFIQTIDQQGNVADINAVQPMTTSGTVASIQGYCNGTTNGETVSFCLYKNDAATTLTGSCSSTGDSVVWYTNAPDTSISFVAGDRFSIALMASDSSINQSFSASFDVLIAS